MRGGGSPTSFLTRITCCLRGGQEHKDLKFSQVKRKTVKINGTIKVCYEYTEYGSKNRSGGLKQLKMENKVVVQYEDRNAGERCHVDILDLYFLKVPKEVMKTDTFYLQPLQRCPSDPTKPWFSKQPMGRNKLGQMMKNMGVQAGLSKMYTNHSLRAFGASKMFQQGVPEKLIQERTGHRSIEALRKYEQTSDEQKEEISLIMNAAIPTSVPNQVMWHPVNSQGLNNPSNSRPQTQPLFSGCAFSGYSFTVNVIQQPADDDYLQVIDIKDIFTDM